MKNWYLSKTLWANVIALALIWLNHRGHVITDAEAASVTVVMNLVLRIVTKEALRFRDPNGQAAGVGVRVLMFALLLPLVTTGCATRYVYNQSKELGTARVRAVQARDLGNGAVGLGVDLSALDILAEQPVKQIGAGLLDAATIYGAVKGGQWIADQVNGGDDDKKPRTEVTAIDINGSGNTVIYGGKGNAVSGNHGDIAPPPAAPVEVVP